MLTQQDYTTLKTKNEVYQAARFTLCGTRNCVTVNEQKQLPEPCSNDELSAMEVYEFITDPPVKYFLYVDVKQSIVTTWTGDKLGDCWLGRKYRSNMGDTRQSIDIHAINGKHYAGTFFTSAGDYARVKVCKS